MCALIFSECNGEKLFKSANRNYMTLQKLKGCIDDERKFKTTKSARKCIPYNNRCVQNFIQIG